MSQPEMQPDGSAQDGRGEGPGLWAEPWEGAAGPWADDLAGRPFPHGDWAVPAERLDELYRWVERTALETAAWYLGNRMGKRLAARVLRVGAAAGALVGAGLPLLDVTGVVGGMAPWGYLALLGCVACVAVDRFFGVTSGWMRDVATAQAVHRRLLTLQFDWASENAREVLGPTEGTAGEAAERCLAVLRRFSEDVTELVRSETADWMVEFRAGTAPLGIHSGGSVSRPSEIAPGGRLPLPPSTRPNMPRQRPPEAR